MDTNTRSLGVGEESKHLGTGSTKLLKERAAAGRTSAKLSLGEVDLDTFCAGIQSRSDVCHCLGDQVLDELFARIASIPSPG